MYKVKKFKKSEVFTDVNGDKHVILVYGELTTTNQLNGFALAKVKYVLGDSRIVNCEKPVILNSSDSISKVKEFNFGWAICEPRDTYDEKVGIELCKKRFGKTPISTQEVKFLTDDMIDAILENEIKYLKNERLIPNIKVNENTKTDSVKCSHNENKYEGIVNVTFKNGKKAFGVYDYEKNGVTYFHWLVKYASSQSEDNGNMKYYNESKFSSPTSIDNNLLKDMRIAKQSEIKEYEAILKNNFNKILDSKNKTIKTATKIKPMLFNLF